MRLRKLILVTGASLCLLATPAFAGEAFVSGGKLIIKPDQRNGFNYTLTVVGPHGFYADGKSAKNVPSVSLLGKEGISDGIYRWQLSGSTQVKIRNPKPDFYNGRDQVRPEMVNKSFDESGSFRVIKGVAQMPKEEEEKGSGGDEK